MKTNRAAPIAGLTPLLTLASAEADRHADDGWGDEVWNALVDLWDCEGENLQRALEEAADAAPPGPVRKAARLLAAEVGAFDR